MKLHLIFNSNFIIFLEVKPCLCFQRFFRLLDSDDAGNVILSNVANHLSVNKAKSARKLSVLKLSSLKRKTACLIKNKETFR
jgi:hypothetical protein